MRRCHFAVLTIACGLGHPVIAQEPDSARPTPAYALTLPVTYPKSESLAKIESWLQAEFSRIATREHYERLKGVDRPPGACGGSISPTPRLEVLTREEWAGLSQRCTTQLGDTDPRRVGEAIDFGHFLQQVSMWRPEAGLLSPALRNAVAVAATHSDPQTRSKALGLQSVLPSLEPDNSIEVASAVLALADPSADVRAQAVKTLHVLCSSNPPEANALGEAAPGAIALLLPFANGDDRRTCAAAILVLANTGEHAASLMPEFLRWLNAADRTRRGSVFLAVRSLGSRAAPLVPRLIEIASDPANSERPRAVSALGHTRAAGQPAVAMLTAVATSDDPQLSSSARASLRNLGTVALGAAPALRAHAQKHCELAKECEWVADILEGKRLATDPYPQ